MDEQQNVFHCVQGRIQFSITPTRNGSISLRKDTLTHQKTTRKFKKKKRKIPASGSILKSYGRIRYSHAAAATFGSKGPHATACVKILSGHISHIHGMIFPFFFFLDFLNLSKLILNSKITTFCLFFRDRYAPFSKVL